MSKHLKCKYIKQLTLITAVLNHAHSIAMAQDRPASNLTDIDPNESRISPQNPDSLPQDPLGQKSNGLGDWQSVPVYHNDRISNIRLEQIVEPAAEYHFSGFGNANPFEPPALSEIPTNADILNADGALASQRLKGYEIPVVSPLQNYPLSQLELKGILLLKEKIKKALIMTPNKEGIMVTVGDPISAGKVMDIFKDRIMVRQYRLRKDGAREFDDVELYINKRAKPPDKGFLKLTPGGHNVFTTPKLLDDERREPAVKGDTLAKAPSNEAPPKELIDAQQQPAVVQSGTQSGTQNGTQSAQSSPTGAPSAAPVGTSTTQTPRP